MQATRSCVLLACGFAAGCGGGSDNNLTGGVDSAVAEDTGSTDAGSNGDTGAAQDSGAPDSGPMPRTDASSPPPDGGATGFVQARGTSLVLAGQPFRFLGLNRYPLAGGPQAASCTLSTNATTYASLLDSTLSGMSGLGATVARFWAFQNYAGPSGTDYTEFDQVVATAKKYGIRLIFTLENEWTACSQPSTGQKDAAWYQGGYKSPYGNYRLSMPAYVTGLVAHFKNEPQILMWQLMNEAESTDPTALRQFAIDLATQIKAVDSNHLVNVGTLACGQNGTTGFDYQTLHADPHIDLLEAHDYGHDSTAMPSCITTDFQVANTLNKPFFIGEAGISITTTTMPTRATEMDAKIKAAASAPFPGWAMWAYGTGQYDVYYPGDSDPLVQVLQTDSRLF